MLYDRYEERTGIQMIEQGVDAPANSAGVDSLFSSLYAVTS